MHEPTVAIDAMTYGRRFPRFALPRPGMESCIVVARQYFDDDLLCAFPMRGRMESIRRQVEVDAPRCRLEIEGIRIASVPCAFEYGERILALCTQAVMGLPVELLHRSIGMVTEPLREETRDGEMVIRVKKDGEFVVHKRLTLHAYGNMVPVVVFMFGCSDMVHMHVARDD